MDDFPLLFTWDAEDDPVGNTQKLLGRGFTASEIEDLVTRNWGRRFRNRSSGRLSIIGSTAVHPRVFVAFSFEDHPEIPLRTVYVHTAFVPEFDR